MDMINVHLVTSSGDQEFLVSPYYVTGIKNSAKVRLNRLPHIIYHSVAFWPVGEFDIVFKLPEATETISLAIETSGEPLTSSDDAKSRLLQFFSGLV